MFKMAIVRKSSVLASTTVGWPPFIQAGAFVSHLSMGGHVVSIPVPADPSNRNQPGRSPLSH